MRKIGVISDVHGDLEALKTALPYLRNLGCEEIIHTGDVVDIGPHSRECLEMLLRNGVLCLLGNHDKDFLLDHAYHGPLSHVSAKHKQYVFATMDENQRAQVARFPLFAERTLGGKKVIFEHYCRNNPEQANHSFHPIENHPSAEKFDEIYDGYDCDAVFFGHKHEPCEFVGKRLYVDVGSVGCHPEPLACGVVIEFDETHFDYRRFALPYNREQTRRDMTDGTLPSGDYLFDFYFLHKPNMPDVTE